MPDSRETMIKLIESLSPEKVTEISNTIFSIEIVRNLLCNAFEMGGLNSWVDHCTSNYKEVGANYPWEAPLMEGGHLTLIDFEGRSFKIDRHAIDEGLESWLLDQNFNHHIVDAITENDDVITGDIFYQHIAMNEVIYG